MWWGFKSRSLWFDGNCFLRKRRCRRRTCASCKEVGDGSEFGRPCCHRFSDLNLLCILHFSPEHITKHHLDPGEPDQEETSATLQLMVFWNMGRLMSEEMKIRMIVSYQTLSLIEKINYQEIIILLDNKLAIKNYLAMKQNSKSRHHHQRTHLFILLRWTLHRPAMLVVFLFCWTRPDRQ